MNTPIIEWSLDKPKEDGYYWVWSPTEPTFIIEVMDRGIHYCKNGIEGTYKIADLPLYGYAYFGPIHPPPIPVLGKL